MVRQQSQEDARVQVRALHRKSIENLRREATQLAHAATFIANACNQTLAEGGTLSAQRQMSFLTGALARMTKDNGVIEALQSMGFEIRPPQQKG